MRFFQGGKKFILSLVFIGFLLAIYTNASEFITNGSDTGDSVFDKAYRGETELITVETFVPKEALLAIDEVTKSLDNLADEVVETIGNDSKRTSKTIDVIGDSSKWIEELSSTELKALRDYQGNDIYEELNKGLRNNNLDPKYAETVQNIDNAIAKGVLGNDTTLYRGFTYDEILDNWDDIVADQSFIYADKAFVSTSLDKGTAYDFVEQYDNGEGIIAVIKAKEGINCANLGAIDDFEKEILLGRGHKYEVVKAWIEDGVKHIEVEVMD